MGIFDFLKNIIPSSTTTIKPALPPVKPLDLSKINSSPSAIAGVTPLIPLGSITNKTSTPATANPIFSAPPAVGGTFQTQPVPQVTAPTATATVAPPVLPAATSAPKPTAPATPMSGVGVKAPTGMEYGPNGQLQPIQNATSSQNPAQVATSTPAAPATPAVTPEALKAQSDATALYQKSLQLSPDELSTQEDLDKLLESAKKSYVNAEDQAIPLEFITGQLASIERRANALAEPLQTKLARLQSQRTSSLDASKFALDRADKEVESQRSAAQTAKTDAEKKREFDATQSMNEKKLTQDQTQFNTNASLAQKKFAEDTKQFGQTYAQNERKIAQDAALAREKLAADKTPTGQVQGEALGNYQLVNDLLNLDPSSITGVGQNPLNFLGVTNQEAINKYNQLQGILALDNRQKLKGSGAISDFESRTLTQAASSLGRNLPNDAFKRELNKIKGVFANAAGLEANVKVTDPKSGTAKEGTLSRTDINSAIAQGYNIEYQ